MNICNLMLQVCHLCISNSTGHKTWNTTPLIFSIKWYFKSLLWKYCLSDNLSEGSVVFFVVAKRLCLYFGFTLKVKISRRRGSYCHTWCYFYIHIPLEFQWHISLLYLFTNLFSLTVAKSKIDLKQILVDKI